MPQNTQGMRERFDERFYEEVNSFMGVAFGDKKLDDEIKHFIEQEISLALAKERDEILAKIPSEMIMTVDDGSDEAHLLNLIANSHNTLRDQIINNIKQRV